MSNGNAAFSLLSARGCNKTKWDIGFSANFRARAPSSLYPRARASNTVQLRDGNAAKLALAARTVSLPFQENLIILFSLDAENRNAPLFAAFFPASFMLVYQRVRACGEKSDDDAARNVKGSHDESCLACKHCRAFV